VKAELLYKGVKKALVHDLRIKIKCIDFEMYIIIYNNIVGIIIPTVLPRSS